MYRESKSTAVAASLHPAGSALRRSFSQEEIVIEALHWINTHYPDSNHDTRMDRLGLLVDFVTDIIPNDRGE